MIMFYNLFEISEENNMKHLVFTYGTLMKGQAAYQRFGESEFVGDATLYDYAIYEVGEYPAAVPLKDFKVEGEVYRISDEQLPLFDEYEDEGDLYIRKTVTVELSNGTKLDTYFYEYNKDVSALELRKPEGKWTPVRKPMSI